MTEHREARGKAEALAAQEFVAIESKPEAAPNEPAPDPADQLVKDEIDAELNVSSRGQVTVLQSLSALFQSLAGPQDQLEAAGGLSRPQFPVPLPGGR